MSTIPLLARRRLCNTFNAQEVGQLRAALQDAGVEFVITQDSRPVGGFSGYGTSGPALIFFTCRLHTAFFIPWR